MAESDNQAEQGSQNDPQFGFESRDEAVEYARDEYGKGGNWDLGRKKIAGKQRYVVKLRTDVEHDSAGNMEVYRDDGGS